MEKKYTAASQVYIFGAQSRAKTLKGYLQFLCPETEILSFIVDNMEGNELSIDGIPVRSLNDVEKPDSLCDIFIATKGIYHQDIRRRLEYKGMRRIIPITVEMDNLMRNEYVKKYFEKERRSFTKLADLTARNQQYSADSAIYMAKSIYDNPLQGCFCCPEYEKPIQAGAALTEQRLSPNILTDCEGENISAKNRQYCELTVLYWIWKHAKEEIVGLSHYRRHFILPDNWQDIMISNKIDVILPVSTYVYPNIAENYKERHDFTDWEFLMRYLEKNSPDDYAMTKKVFSENLYYPCNMFIMQRKILNDMCSWLFPIIDAAAEHGGTKEDAYLNRYPGFISERLITLFFEIHRDEYHIVYADKNFIY